MKKDIVILKEHLSDLQSTKRKIIEQDVLRSLSFMESIGDLLKKHRNADYEQEAEKISKSYNIVNDLTTNLSVKLDKWIADLENQINELEQ